MTGVVDFSHLQTGVQKKWDTADDIKDVVESIRDTEVLQLKLSGNSIGVPAARALADALRQKSTIKELHFADVFTGRLKSEIPGMLSAWTDALLESGCRLKLIDLADNALGPDPMKALVPLFRSRAFRTVEILNLNNTGLGPYGSKVLGKILYTAQKQAERDGESLQLREVWCGRSRVENIGAKWIGRALEEMSTLEVFRCIQSGINHRGARSLARGLAHNPRLRELDMEDNVFKPKGCGAFADILGGLNNLEVLNFSDCFTGVRGTKALAKSLRNHPSLRRLVLENNEMNLSAALAVVDTAKTVKSLQVLRLDGNNFGDAGWDEIRGQAKAANLEDILQHDEEADFFSDEDTGDEEDCDTGGEDSDMWPDDDYLDQLDPELGAHEEPSGNEEPNSVETFIKRPSEENLRRLEPNAAVKLALRVKTSDGRLREAVRVFVLCGALLHGASSPQARELVLACADAVVKAGTEASQPESDLVTNLLLEHLGLIKSEEKVEPVKTLRGQDGLLKHAASQGYLAEDVVSRVSKFLVALDSDDAAGSGDRKADVEELARAMGDLRTA